MIYVKNENSADQNPINPGNKPQGWKEINARLRSCEIFVPGTVIRQVEAEMLRQHNEAREPFVLKLYGLRGALLVMYALLFIYWGQKKSTGWGKTWSECFL